jgi:hypothetical protein
LLAVVVIAADLQTGQMAGAGTGVVVSDRADFEFGCISGALRMALW